MDLNTILWFYKEKEKELKAMGRIVIHKYRITYDKTDKYYVVEQFESMQGRIAMYSVVDTFDEFENMIDNVLYMSGEDTL